MGRWGGRILLAALLVVGATGADAGRAATPGNLSLAAALAAGVGDGLALGADGALRLADAARPALSSDEPFARVGDLLGPPLPLAAPAATVAASWAGATPPGAAVRLEVRGWSADGRATPWEEAAGSGALVTLPTATTALQYRLTLLAGADGPGPTVRAVALRPLPGSVLAPAAAAAPTARLYTTRIGLIGGTTANGHVIGPDDRFAALPSRRVLASKGGGEYQIRVAYRGRTITVPIWDTGPWNVRDNFWDASTRRDMWNDLPPGQPQSTAAYFDAYHGGRDGFGRRVRNPAGLDLSDAAFADLGMTGGDYVTVTFLWLAPGG